ncbi:MazG nucleotide pyrophosphohydrolase domain-containing protein [Reinekea sp.]|jgi:NTP pyrophosphatase (non-canonical NTP hydrolase)|uniref:MazG nucleotide pyrophosphohydrolase domain-containing protein n=1 Tax=Reinekea sp. TaxID=1970455 RepID=UPI002A81D0D7|nr:MazG nucleotide pyrophosphohydrolase domain-containing protein [Reinekea sp.]
MPQLAPKPQLADFQRYVAALEVERGFDQQTGRDKCLMLGEEVGELFKAVRQQEGLAMDPNSKVGSIDEELADVFIFVCAIANRYQVDLAAAFRAKEATNKTRIWR